MWGGSYGGYMVLASLIHFSDRICCGVDMVCCFMLRVEGLGV